MMNSIKKWLFAVTGLLIIATVVLLSKFYIVDAAVKDTQKFEDWSVSCVKDAKNNQICLLTQQLSNTKDDKTEVIALYQMGYFDKEKKQLKMLQTLPLGVNLQAGTAIIPDEKNAIANGKFVICTAAGCQAVAEISDKDLNSILGSDKNLLAIINAEGKQVNLPISVKGLKEGLEALKK